MTETFDYWKLMHDYREAIWNRIAEYTFEHPEMRLSEIAAEFNTSISTVAHAGWQRGVKRGRARKSWPKKVATAVANG